MISFKSVGITDKNLTEQRVALAAKPLPIGLITPLRLGDDNDGLLAMHYSVGETMKNNLRDLIMTNWGERVALYDYGANLQPLVTEYNDKNVFDEAAMQRISNAVAKWMPYVELQGFESSSQPSPTQFGLALIKIIIEYSIPRAQIPNTRIQITFAVC